MTKVASIQFQIKDEESKEQRFQRVSKLIDKARGANIILLPEMWNIGFLSFENYESWSEPLNGPTADFLSKKANEVNAYILGGSIVERCDGKMYNTAQFFGPDGKMMGFYRKIHLVTRAGAAEARLLTGGESPTVVDCDFGKVGLSICYDLRFPELFRTMAVNMGAEVFLHTASWPLQRTENWIDMIHVRANENQAWLVACGMCGVNAGVQNFGHSGIVDPNGISIAGAGLEETIVTGDIDLDYVRDFRKKTPHFTSIRLWKKT
jgi:predicted amidohydrolase